MNMLLIAETSSKQYITENILRMIQDIAQGMFNVSEIELAQSADVN